MNEDDAKKMLVQLSQYYGEPVMRVSDFCGRLFKTFEAVSDEARREADGEDPKTEAADFVAAWRSLWTARKSNLLWRVLYGGEMPRTERCPIHKGKWAGCAWGDDACPHCMSGSNVTGWVKPAADKSLDDDEVPLA